MDNKILKKILYALAAWAFLVLSALLVIALTSNIGITGKCVCAFFDGLSFYVIVKVIKYFINYTQE